MTSMEIAVWVTAFATVALAIIAWFQLGALVRESKANNLRQRKWATLSACEKFDTDPIIEQATLRIWNDLRPRDYKDQEDYERDIIIVLNYLDSLAIGIQQNLYEERIVYDHMNAIFRSAVTNFLLPPHGVVDRSNFTALIDINDRWVKRQSAVLFKDRDPA